MKTAIVKTDFWLDDGIFELNSDTRLLYLCLLTNPNRDTTQAFKCSDRLLSAYTGYSRDLIEICRKQLILAGMIIVVEDYYIFNEQDYVQPAKGRDSFAIHQRDYEKLPSVVRDKINTLKSSGSSTGTSSGTPSGGKDKDINKAIDIDKAITNELPEEALVLAGMLRDNVKQNFDFVKDTPEMVRRWADDIDRINRLDDHSWQLIRGVIIWSQKNPFWRKNIRSGSKLRDKFETLLVEIKSERDKKNDSVDIV